MSLDSPSGQSNRVRFEALANGKRSPTALPTQPTSFIWREDESRDVLASVRDPKLVPHAVATAFGVQDRGDRPLVDVLASALRDRHLLLIHDNFEHLLGKSPTWLSDLLGRCLRLKALVTSRIALNIGGEHRYLVPPLAVPAAEAVPEPADSAAVRLFVTRAHAIRADFSLDAANSGSVTEVCRRLDGLPLAIVLAAAQVNMFTPDQLLSRLNGQLGLLTSTQRDPVPRQQSMRDTMVWSYDLLSSDEQRLFHHLSVFVGGFTLDAAEMVVAPSGLGVVDAVSSLVDKSLLRRVDEASGETRFAMLDTIREFGRERLVACGEEQAVRDRHADWCVDLAGSATPNDPASQLAWFDHLETEHDNLGVAVAWLDDTGRMNDLADVVTEARWLWYQPGRETRGLMWVERLLAQHPSVAGSTPDRSAAVKSAQLSREAELLATLGHANPKGSCVHSQTC